MKVNLLYIYKVIFKSNRTDFFLKNLLNILVHQLNTLQNRPLGHPHTSDSESSRNSPPECCSVSLSSPLGPLPPSRNDAPWATSWSRGIGRSPAVPHQSCRGWDNVEMPNLARRSLTIYTPWHSALSWWSFHFPNRSGHTCIIQFCIHVSSST